MKEPFAQGTPVFFSSMSVVVFRVNLGLIVQTTLPPFLKHSPVFYLYCKLPRTSAVCSLARTVSGGGNSCHHYHSVPCCLYMAAEVAWVLSEHVGREISTTHRRDVPLAIIVSSGLPFDPGKKEYKRGSTSKMPVWAFEKVIFDFQM